MPSKTFLCEGGEECGGDTGQHVQQQHECQHTSLCEREERERRTAMPSTAATKRQSRYVRVPHESNIFHETEREKCVTERERDYYKTVLRVNIWSRQRDPFLSVNITSCKLPVH
jgi:hypothetical protein